ncbi:hypothetical protein CRI94_07285 [Longibacter salinarum]|uniref:Uncharacterized protein n=1 Tax=Longibacter salinarum TaxID=1850348 RepID=A0A2A8CYX4_9BACT|nr:hypothetical protein CRI94_07285 [Longibacter salinarum]
MITRSFRWEMLKWFRHTINHVLTVSRIICESVPPKKTIMMDPYGEESAQRGVRWIRICYLTRVENSKINLTYLQGS